MKKQQYERIGRNVVFGYILLAVIALVSISYLYTIIEKIAAEEDVNTVPRQKIYLVTNTQTLLYESETMGQLIDMPEDDYTYYNETLDQAAENMEQLRLLVADTLFHQKIDTIQMLLERKRDNTALLLQIWKEANADLYAKNIRKALEQKSEDVSLASVSEQVNVKQDTVIVQSAPKKKTFFKRLAEVFVPSEVRDSSIRLSGNQQVVKDTTLNTYNPDEAISKTLRGIQSSVASERERLRVLLVDRSSALRYDNSVISARINQILRSIEEEELQASVSRLEKRQDILEKTSWLISVIAMVSLGVAIFFLFFIGRDLSKSKYYRKQLEKEKKYTENLLNSREKLILTIGHDIRAPLSSIIGYTELLQRSFPDEKQRMYLRNMSGSSGHILSLVNDLLDFQRLDSGQMEIHEIPFKIPELCNDIYQSFQPQAASKGLELKLRLETASDAVYMGDPIRIRQIAGNLLSNALKFTNEGAVTLLVDCPQPEDATTATLTITVSDTGAGIPEAEQERIFAEFTRLAGAEKTEGFGLGLSITSKLTALLGGMISLHSVEGQGSDFTVTIPLTLAENQTLPETESETDVKANPFADRSVTCLIIDDDLLQIVLMEEILKQNHLNVVSCTNPRLVLDMLKKAHFDIVITDIQMPGMDGYDLIRQIRSSDLSDADTIPVVALSATVGRDHKRYEEAGFTDSLSKPFSSEELITLLKKIIPDLPDTGKRPDFSSLTAFAGEDKTASDNIMRTFSAETQKNLSLLKQALAESDRKLSERISHKMIPVSTMLGANTLVQQLRILERDDVEISDAGWRHLLSDVIRQIESMVTDAELGSE